MLDTHGLEVIDERGCFHLLQHAPVGRLGFSSGALPVIYPVNYVLLDKSVIMGSDDGDKARAARNGVVACLEVDHFDAMEHTGWSVLATGRLTLVDPTLRSEMEHLPLVPWGLSSSPNYLSLQIELISGRRIRHVASG